MFRPKFFVLLPQISKSQILNDIVAGVLVGIVALPLAIAFGIASGVSPEKGIITAIIGGFIVSFLGGSRVQIGGPTGAFIVIVYGIVEKFGLDGLIVATIMAGVILIIMGFAQLGSIIKFIPYPVIVGFTSGIAVVIFSSQVNDFFGLNIEKVPADFVDKWTLYFQNFSSINYETFFIGIFSFLIILFWPKVSRKIPGSIIAIFVSTILVHFFQMNVATIESRFGEIPSSFPSPSIPIFDLATIKQLILPATTIAILAAIESLLSAVVADGMIGGKHKSNMELVATGIANIFTPLFGGIPVTGAIARTATNIKNGGRTPIAGMVHAITLLGIMLLLGQWAKLIPMATLAAILIVVAYNMSEHRIFRQLLKSPRSDVAVLLTTFGLTVVFDLTIAIEVGMILAVILFMRRMANVSNINVITREINDSEEADDAASIQTKIVPDGVQVYEINGPFFFGAASKFKGVMNRLEIMPEVVIFRMRNVPAIDATGLNLLSQIIRDNKNKSVHLIFSGVHDQPLEALKNYNLTQEIGEENIFNNIDDALQRSKELVQKKYKK
ncbi:MAG: STAS domain-containing protein [Melioribacteraceae bacterium]|nr:STAS domain-containing protein [Melioribacteraceae bacterium]MCF8264810.1 STAS domain-containing protein [Melioribacteraceae bacterium]MCF8414411.1 STAS domain-containing protein [Melioribacteraceae bacterium]MCF8430353.1 STAS domain-containing protein [Melioribacteraceae bacterium]